MLIDQNNIADFISHLFYKRKGTLPPQDLLERWRALSNEEIDRELSGLFQSWGLSELHKREEIRMFLEQIKPPATPASTTPRSPTPPPTPTYSHTKTTTAKAPKPVAATRSYARWFWLLLLPIVVAGGYIAYQYFMFSTRQYLYAITNNIVVRDGNKQVVARMDIKDRSFGEVPTVEKLKAYDNKVYYRAIDTSDKTYPCRKVMLREDDFWSFVTEAEDNVGYVNTNYVVDDLGEFTLYKTVFNDVAKSRAANDDLKAMYRRIIIGSMNKAPELKSSFIVLHDFGLSREALTRSTAVHKETIEKNIAYHLYVGLNDNRYYRFEGDIQNNVYHEPQVLMLYRDGESAEPLQGNYRFYSKGNNVHLYDCSEKKFTEHIAERDGSGRITGFKFIAPTEPTLLDQVDSALDDFKNVVDSLF